MRRFSLPIVGLALLLAVISVTFALRGERGVSVEMLVDEQSPTLKASNRYADEFGEQSIVVMVRGPLPQIVLTENLGRLVGLEGCLSGNKPKGAPVLGGNGSPCAKLAASKAVKVVYGPGTFVNSAVTEIQGQIRSRLRGQVKSIDRLAKAASAIAKSQGQSQAEQGKAEQAATTLGYARIARELIGLGNKYGLPINRLPRIDDPEFVSTLVFDPSRSAASPKARFSFLFPNDQTAIIQVRLKSNLSKEVRSAALRDIRAAVNMPQWKLDGAEYLLTGAPLILDDVGEDLVGSLFSSMLFGALLMAIVLLLIFRVRRRVVPLIVAMCSVSITYGLLASLGMPLDVVALAALPIIFGLGVDYAIQYQARRIGNQVGLMPSENARIAGDRSRMASNDSQLLGKGNSMADNGSRIPSVIRALATSCLAGTVGFLALLISPLPMVNSFGLFLAIGSVAMLAVTLIFGEALLMVIERFTDKRLKPPNHADRQELSNPGKVEKRLTTPWLGSKRLAFQRFRRRTTSPNDAHHGLLVVFRHPRFILAFGLIIACVGWGFSVNSSTVSDPHTLLPEGLESVRNLHALEQDTGVAGEVSLLVEGNDLASSTAMAWMRDYQTRVLKHFGVSSEKSCGKAELCTALSLPDLFGGSKTKLTRERIQSLLGAIPPYFTQAVISQDRRAASLSFGVKIMSLNRQREVVDWLKSQLHPPQGIKATLVGLPVIAAEANSAADSTIEQLLLMGLSLLGVIVVLALVYRNWRRILLILTPVILATGWSALTVQLIGIQLNPLSALVGTFVIVITTQFALILTARYDEERRKHHNSNVALLNSYRLTGRAVVASALTAIAGFAALIMSDTPLLRDFGIITVVDLFVSLIGVLTALPAVVLLFDRASSDRHWEAPQSELKAEKSLIGAVNK